MGNSDSEYNVKSFHGTDFLDQLVSTASENIGTRYRTGGTTKDGFDCSGLMCTTFGNFDIQLPRTSIEQSQYGVKIDNDDAQKGDLIFFKTNGRRQINHVGMVVEAVDGDIKFIHASVSGGVMISSIKEKYYRKKVSQINRVL
jgi:cell wall-associated NlpC family hydrolase